MVHKKPPQPCFHARFEAVMVLRESDPIVTLTSKVRFLGKSSKKWPIELGFREGDFSRERQLCNFPFL
jgi:hypothetical protein